MTNRWRRIITSTNNSGVTPEEVCQNIEGFLDSKKAQDIVCIDLADKSTMADYMIVASGASSRQIKMLAELLKEHLHQEGIKPIFMEGMGACDWVLVDAGSVIVHLFRPEVRAFYNLEKMWGVELADFARQVSGRIHVE